MTRKRRSFLQQREKKQRWNDRRRSTLLVGQVNGAGDEIAIIYRRKKQLHRLRRSLFLTHVNPVCRFL